MVQGKLEVLLISAKGLENTDFLCKFTPSVCSVLLFYSVSGVVRMGGRSFWPLIDVMVDGVPRVLIRPGKAASSFHCSVQGISDDSSVSDLSQ